MKTTLFQSFINHPQVQEAFNQIINQLKAHQSKLKANNTSTPSLSTSYQEALESIKRIKGSPLFFPYLSSGLGKGCLVELADGSVKYDFISGIGAHFSHSDPEIIAAALKGAVMDTVMQGNLQQHQGSVELYHLFQQLSGLDHVFLTSSGVMAVENALKIAFHYKKNARRILSFDSCFSGRSICAAGITDKAKYRIGLPQAFEVDYLPFYSEDKHQTETCLNLLHQYLERYPQQHACMMFELIQGEGGFNVGNRDFFIALMKVLKAHDIPIYIDETQTFGHTTACFAFQHFKLEDYVDIVSVGKLSQTCATLYNKKHHPLPGLLSQTFTSSTVAIETAKVILKKLLTQSYFGPNGFNETCFSHFKAHLEILKKEFPGNIRGPFGSGAMIAFEVFEGDPEKTTQFLHLLFQKGLIAFINGSKKLKIRFLLPIGGIRLEDLDMAADIIGNALNEFIHKESQQ